MKIFWEREKMYTHASINVEVAVNIEVVEGDVVLGMGAGRGLRPGRVIRKRDPVASDDGS